MIVILTALEVEYRAMREQLSGLRRHRHSAGTLFEIGAFERHPEKEIALALTTAGNASAAIMTERAINEFSPQTVIFVGVAGGLAKWLVIGDVVVATKVYAYHGERSEGDGDKFRPRAYEPSHELEQLARSLARKNEWCAETGAGQSRPQVHFEPIASGEVVLNTRNSPTARLLDRNFNDAVAVETEGAGVAQSAHLQGDLPTITVRGISDFADGNKDAVDRTGSQELAARHAALFARALILAIEPGTGPGHDEPPEQAGPKGMSVVNNVHGKGNNVVQAGVINGGVQMGGRPPRRR
ncbi:MAG TPA: 5'-methylthioadenosine/S-adenosylhomocysteine nucleosidase [Pseudonocardiaceae bacterium]|nr:5'-methylthioadenosine/S-adenosylhomocysteine nucleosidase [Pseudonocardiaceae bacterium]